MLFQAAKNGCSIEFILEQVDFSSIRKIVAPWIEVVYVDTWQCHVLQILVQPLLSRQFTRVWEVIEKVCTAENFLDFVMLVIILPEYLMLEGS